MKKFRRHDDAGPGWRCDGLDGRALYVIEGVREEVNYRESRKQKGRLDQLDYNNLHRCCYVLVVKCYEWPFLSSLDYNKNWTDIHH